MQELQPSDGDNRGGSVATTDRMARGDLMESATLSASSRSGPTTEVVQMVDQAQVRTLFPSGTPPETADIGTRELIGRGFTYRHDWGDRRGQLKLSLTWGAINANSRVFVAVGEGAPGAGKFVGNARFTLHNVAPNNGVVTIWVNVEWGDPIRLYADYLVVNP